MNPAESIVERLRIGNGRFRKGVRAGRVQSEHRRPEDVVDGQKPHAVIVGCSDSRVPPEIVFDQGIGDLFVIRVAGAVVTPAVLGSVEYAVEELSVPLVLVLGHTRCGAVQSTVEAIESSPGSLSPNLEVIVGSLRPAVESVLGRASMPVRSEVMDSAVEAGVRVSVLNLEAGSSSIRRRIEGGQLVIVGAVYRMETGAVEFLGPRADLG